MCGAPSATLSRAIKRFYYANAGRSRLAAFAVAIVFVANRAFLTAIYAAGAAGALLRA
jgi:hypothetical protein